MQTLLHLWLCNQPRHFDALCNTCRLQVAVHCTTADRRVFTDAEVVHKDSIADVVILKVSVRLG